MKTSDFDYNLPQERIAQEPIRPRDHSKLMLVDKNKKEIEHKHFYDIVDHFKKGDLIVWNNSKVFKARLFGQLESVESGELLHEQKVEIFLVRPKENEGVWQVLAKPGRRVKPGMRVRFAHSTGSGQASDFYCDVMIKKKTGDILVQFPDSEEVVREKANQHGHIPIPPYVKDEPHELEVYQTVYAKHEGSVAAPTAGFHFTPELIEKLKEKGVDFCEVTLHVGLGTFLPVKSEKLEDHTMHAEWVEVSEEVVGKINKVKAGSGRVVAVGTTSVRTLEGVVETFGSLKPYKGDINLFITPGFEFKVVDAMITNFHLPKSTLLMLVSAFVGDRKFMLDCYKKAVEDKYRFYSFGDGMFIN